MTVPVKTLADTRESSNPDSDSDPHVTALATGGFALEYSFLEFGESTLEIDTFSATGQRQVIETGSRYYGAANEGSGYSLDNGDMIVAWTATPTGGSGDIYAALFSPRADDVVGFGAPFLVNDFATTGTQVRPEVTALANGSLAFAWVDKQTDSVVSVLFSHFGDLVGLLTAVSTTPSAPSSVDLGLAPLSNGNYVVSWQSDSAAEHFRIFDKFGDPVTGDVTISNLTVDGDVTQLADGNLEFVYNGLSGVRGHTFSSAGVSLGAEFQISSDRFAEFPSITALHDGRFMVVYQNGEDIFGRIMNDTGVPAGPEFRVNTDPTGTQAHPHLDTLTNGNVVVAWEDSRTGNGDIYYTILDPVKSHDLDADGFSDIVLQTAGGQTALWEMDGHGLKDSLSMATINPAYVIQDIADFNHDGHGDLLFRHSNGDTLLWTMNGNVNTGQFDIGTINPNYVIQGAADFNGDGNADILFRGTAAGDTVLWTMNGGVNTGQFSIGTLNPNYKIQAVNDFDGDGKADILFRGASGGDAIIWTMNGAVNTGQSGIGTINLSYHVAGTGDFNGDGNADILWRSDAGELVLWTMTGGTNTGQFTVGPVNPIYQVADIEDFNGDGHADILFRSSNDEVIWTMNGATNIGQVGLAATGIDSNAFQVVQHHYDLV